METSAIRTELNTNSIKYTILNWNAPNNRWPNQADDVTVDHNDVKTIKATTGDRSKPNKSNELISTKLNLLLELLYLVLFVNVGNAYKTKEISKVI